MDVCHAMLAGLCPVRTVILSRPMGVVSASSASKSDPVTAWIIKIGWTLITPSSTEVAKGLAKGSYHYTRNIPTKDKWLGDVTQHPLFMVLLENLIYGILTKA